MYQYTTNKNRIVLSENDLSYALVEGTLFTTNIRSSDMGSSYDIPNDADLAAFIEAAISVMPSAADHNIHKRKLKTALADIGSEAAKAHTKCLKVPAKNQHPMPAFSYLYITTAGRYAVSRANLAYAATDNNPAIITENAVTIDDLMETCFVPDHKTAAYLTKAVCSFHGTEATDHALCNTILQSGSPATYVVYDVGGYKPFDEVIAQSSEMMQRMYLSAFEEQLSLCRLYLSLHPVA